MNEINGSLLRTEQSFIKTNTLKYNLQKLYLSCYIQLIYIILIILTFLSFIWVLLHENYHRNLYSEDRWIIILEVLICGIVFIDLIIRVYLVGLCLFIRSVMNIIDIVLTVFCVIEIVIALFDVLIVDFHTIMTLIVLIVRNCFMMVRIFILMRRTIAMKKVKDVSIVVETDRGESLDTILEGNRESIKIFHRARLDTLGEEDEMFEDGLNQKNSVWRGRVKHGLSHEDLDPDE